MPGGAVLLFHLLRHTTWGLLDRLGRCRAELDGAIIAGPPTAKFDKCVECTILDADSFEEATRLQTRKGLGHVGTC